MRGGRRIRKERAAWRIESGRHPFRTKHPTGLHILPEADPEPKAERKLEPNREPNGEREARDFAWGRLQESSLQPSEFGRRHFLTLLCVLRAYLVYLLFMFHAFGWAARDLLGWTVYANRMASPLRWVTR